MHTSANIMLESSLPQSKPETAHILFMDIVGYSKLTMNDQRTVQEDLRLAVQSTEEYQEARSRDQLICRPAGDGMSLLFFGGAFDPVRCAVQITGALHGHRHIRLRMGIHSGQVLRVLDINAHWDIAGDGIVVAQRVMDLGDAGHILLSGDCKSALENIQDYRYPMGHLFLSEMGSCLVKHGHSVRVFSLRDRHYGEPKFGNPIIPKKLRPTEPLPVLVPPESPLLRSLLNSLKIVLSAILLATLLGGACYLTAPGLYADVVEGLRMRPSGTQAKIDRKPDTASQIQLEKKSVEGSGRVPDPFNRTAHIHVKRAFRPVYARSSRLKPSEMSPPDVPPTDADLPLPSAEDPLVSSNTPLSNRLADPNSQGIPGDPPQITTIAPVPAALPNVAAADTEQGQDKSGRGETLSAGGAPAKAPNVDKAPHSETVSAPAHDAVTPAGPQGGE